MILNGCSYPENWHSFPGKNLSLWGTGYDRAFRTTIEYCASYGKPSYVFLAIPFIHRTEFVFDIHNDKLIEGPYEHSQQNDELADFIFRFQAKSNTEYGMFDTFITRLIMFSSFLELHKIPYLIWNQCNLFDETEYRSYNAINKIKYIDNNLRIINLFEFNANEYLYNKGAPLEPGTDCYNSHYDDKYWEEHLKPYLASYLEQNNLGNPL